MHRTNYFVGLQKIGNPKWHLITSSSVEVSIFVKNYNIKSSNCEKFLGIKIDNKLNFNNNVDEIKKGQKSIKCTVKGHLLYGLTEAAEYVAECVFLVLVQLLSI